MAAGFDPASFWRLTFRSYDLVMRGAAERIRREIEMRNRQAWNTARLTGAAMAGKLPAYETCFGRGSVRPGKPQPPTVLAAMGRALALAWGAKMPAQMPANPERK